jgi:hypothetical protein
VSTTEELLGNKSSGSGLDSREYTGTFFVENEIPDQVADIGKESLMAGGKWIRH